MKAFLFLCVCCLVGCAIVLTNPQYVDNTVFIYQTFSHTFSWHALILPAFLLLFCISPTFCNIVFLGMLAGAAGRAYKEYESDDEKTRRQYNRDKSKTPSEKLSKSQYKRREWDLEHPGGAGMTPQDMRFMNDRTAARSEALRKK